jgi:hypothetical protein
VEARVMRCVVALALVLGCAAPSPAQSADDPVRQFPVVYSTTSMTRNADLMLSAAVLSTWGADAALTELSPSLFAGSRPASRAGRIARLAFFDVPVTVYLIGLNHEWGHQSSAREYDVRSELSFTGTPWNGRPFSLVGVDALPGEPLAEAVVHGGGLEASRRLKDRAEMRMVFADRVAPGHALAAIVASLDAPLYAFYDLSPERFSYESLGDVLTLVRDVGNRRRPFEPQAIDKIRGQVRRRMMLNAIDAALWSETYGLVVDHIWNGDRAARIRWLRVGNARILPALRYELSPYGPEYYAGTLFRVRGTRGRAYGRWTERIGPDRQVGGGVALSRWTLGGVTPRIDIDAWSHTSDGFGMHAGVEADVDRWPGRRAALTVGAGVKSSGHLVGFALDGGAYVTVGVTIRMW